MTDQAEKYNINGTQFLQNAFSVTGVKKENCECDDFTDDRVQISETVVIAGNAILQDNLISDNVKQYDVSTTLDNIKKELPLPKVEYDMIQDNLKKEEEEINAVNIKTEFNNGLLYCEDCHAYCMDYCTECGMLVYILNRNIPVNAASISREDLPNNILEIHEYFGEYHIFALKVVPAGVIFGPFTGLNATELPWKIKGGKFVVHKDRAKYLNWMQYINPARNISQQNLLVFQYERNLYYQSTCQVKEGDELLVYFGEKYDDSLNENVEMDFLPALEQIFKNAFACIFCCLGFSSKSYLAQHKIICPGNTAREFSIEELMQCPFCKIHLEQREYIIHHKYYCCERNDRKCIQPPPMDNQTTEISGRKARRLQMYKCQLCKYRTKYKGDLKNHINQHYELKMYKCGVCCRQFKTREILRLHMENADICARMKEDPEHSTELNMDAHIKAEHSCTQDEIKQFNCSLCEVRTKYKSSLKRHMKTKHWQKTDKRDYKGNMKFLLKTHKEQKHLNENRCKTNTCNYKTNLKSNLKRHIETRHVKEFKYECDTCHFKTNRKDTLKNHIGTRHSTEFKYKCETCVYKTNLKSNLKSHMETKHLNEFKYKCDTCDYKTNLKSHLKSHTDARHLKAFKYKCDTCDYKTNWKCYLKIHRETRHLREFKYKCDTCDYETNRNDRLTAHIETRHLKVFKYRCDKCAYKASRQSHLKAHIEARHLKEFKYTCDTCDYKAKNKSNLVVHVKSKHLAEFSYKCETCGYKTNIMSNFKKHMKTKHL